jgi:hypothetical protein
VNDLIAFINARLDEREAKARAATPGPWHVVADTYGCTINGPDAEQDGGYDPATRGRRRVMRPLVVVGADSDYGAVLEHGDGEHIAANDPARVLAEIDAKRRIINEIVPDVNGMDVQIEGEWGVGRRDEATDPYLGDTLAKVLALPYADHPDYRPEWRP